MAISQRVYFNNAKTSLAAAIGATDTTIPVADTSAFQVTTLTTGQYFLVTLISGTTYEIVQVYGVSNGAFTGCVRAQENTTALAWPSGTTCENRATSGTFGSFARIVDVMAPVASVESLSTPQTSNSETYVSAVEDDGGNPIIAIARSDNTWRFVNHPTTIATGTALSGVTQTFLPFGSASSALGTPASGQYILQFTSGAQIGLPRLVTATSTTGITWSNPLPASPATGDSYMIYQSEYSSLQDLQNSQIDSIIFAIVLGD
jgi:hypothetical protein